MSLTTLFPEYFSLTDETKQRLWQSALFVVDTNVLLDLYRYTEDTRRQLIGVLRSLKDRFWCPHQIAYEFSKNRLKVIARQRRAFDDFQPDLPKKIDQLIASIRQLLKARHHPAIIIETMIGHLKEAESRVLADVQSKEHLIISSADSDPLLPSLVELLESRIGEPYSDEKLYQLITKGRDRYAKKLPPGYDDEKDKPEPERYGDWIVWSQMLDHAMKNSRPIIFVTEDKKEDWWWVESGKTIGPRPELRREFATVAGQEFYMYQTDQFLKLANDYLKSGVEQSAIEEIGKVREVDSLQANELASDTLQQLIESQRPRYVPEKYLVEEELLRPKMVYSNEEIEKMVKEWTRLRDSYRAQVWRLLDTPVQKSLYQFLDASVAAAAVPKDLGTKEDPPNSR